MKICFKAKHNQIILYQQLTSQDKIFGVGLPGVHPLENLYGSNPLSIWGSNKALH